MITITKTHARARATLHTTKRLDQSIIDTINYGIVMFAFLLPRSGQFTGAQLADEIEKYSIHARSRYIAQQLRTV